MAVTALHAYRHQAIKDVSSLLFHPARTMMKTPNVGCLSLHLIKIIRYLLVGINIRDSELSWGLTIWRLKKSEEPIMWSIWVNSSANKN